MKFKEQPRAYGLDPMRNTIVLSFILILTLTACSCCNAVSSYMVSESQIASEVKANQQSSNDASGTMSIVYDSDDMDSTWDSAKTSYITLNGSSITFKGKGIVVDGNKIAITSSGTYYISGKLDDGQIVIRAEDQGTVRLILYGVDIACSTNSPIYVYKANKTVITLAEGAKNYVTDGNVYSFADSTSDEPNAAIFSKNDLTINGNGMLIVKANYFNGIQSKDDLKITGGNIIVQSVNDGIRGRDSIAIRDSNIVVETGGDGMQSNNDENGEKGYIVIQSGTLNINALNDGIQAETKVIVSGGDIKITSGGGSVKSNIDISSQGNPWSNRNGGNRLDSSSLTVSTKGIKAGVDVTIDGGILEIDSLDDAIHSNSCLTINKGNIILASGNDGIHADSTVEINGGDISITKCYEGIEGSAITINNGNIRLVASDDGINVVGGSDGFPLMGPQGQNAIPPYGGQPDQEGFQMIRPSENNPIPPPDRQPAQNLTLPGSPVPGQDNFSSSGDNHLIINGGYIAINAGGDGLDIGGMVNMTGGVVIINGPTANDNGALDHNGFKITGGYLVAVGSAGMAQAPDTSSTQYSVMINYHSLQSTGTMVHIESEDGTSILTFAPLKAYQSVVISSPQFKNGATYIVYSEGSSTGIATDCLYSDGVYTPGTKMDNFTISSIVTRVGLDVGGFPAGPRGNMGTRVR